MRERGAVSVRAHDGAPAAGEGGPHEVAFPAGTTGRRPQQRLPGRVGLHQFPRRGVDTDGRVGEPIQDALEPGAEVAGHERRPRRGDPGAAVEEVPLLPVEAQRPRQGGQHLSRGAPGASLLEAHQIVDRDSGKGGQLLPAQSGGPTAGAGGKPDLGRGQPVPPAAQCRSQLARWCHRSMMASCRPAWVVALIPGWSTDQAAKLIP